MTSIAPVPTRNSASTATGLCTFRVSGSASCSPPRVTTLAAVATGCRVPAADPHLCARRSAFSWPHYATEPEGKWALSLTIVRAGDVNAGQLLGVGNPKQFKVLPDCDSDAVHAGLRRAGNAKLGTSRAQIG